MVRLVNTTQCLFVTPWVSPPDTHDGKRGWVSPLWTNRSLCVQTWSSDHCAFERIVLAKLATFTWTNFLRNFAVWRHWACKPHTSQDANRINTRGQKEMRWSANLTLSAFTCAVMFSQCFRHVHVQILFHVVHVLFVIVWFLCLGFLVLGFPVVLLNQLIRFIGYEMRVCE